MDMLVTNHGDSSHHKILGEKLLLRNKRTKMKIYCIMKGCNEPICEIISITKIRLGKRKKDAIVLKYPLCKDHVLNRDAKVDFKKFKKANPNNV